MFIDCCPCRLNPNTLNNPAGLVSLANFVDTQQVEKAYQDCCQPLHQGIKLADSSEALMRSRYCAFVLVLPDYIVKTTVPAQQPYLNKDAIKDWAEQTPWAGLHIVEHNPKVSKRHAQVEFKAYYKDMAALEESDLSAHHERSTFVSMKENSGPRPALLKTDQSTTIVTSKRLYFIDPTTSLIITQKQPCFCGSGEKFKRCCGQFL